MWQINKRKENAGMAIKSGSISPARLSRFWSSIHKKKLWTQS